MQVVHHTHESLRRWLIMRYCRIENGLSFVWTRPQAISPKYMSYICDLLLVKLALLLTEPQIPQFPLPSATPSWKWDHALLHSCPTLISHQLSPHMALWNISGAHTKPNGNLSNVNLAKGVSNVVSRGLTILSILSSSAFTLSLNKYGIRLGGWTTGVILASMFISYSPGRVPIPLTLPQYLLSISVWGSSSPLHPLYQV